MIYRARGRFQPGTKKWDLILRAVLFPAIFTESPPEVDPPTDGNEVEV
jgi:hypothetical protein